MQSNQLLNVDEFFSNGRARTACKMRTAKNREGDFFGVILQMTVSCCCIKLINSLAAHQYVYRYVYVRPCVVAAQPL